jgi:hypothetical protein
MYTGKKLTQLEEKISSLRSNAKRLEDDYNKITKVSEKAHKKLISNKEKFKQLYEKAIGAGKQNSEEDFKQEISEKDALLKAITDKTKNLEQLKINKQKHHEKDVDKLSKEIADIESKKEDLIKVCNKQENSTK